MPSRTTSKIFILLLSISTLGLSASCTKENDLVSDFVVTEKIEVKSRTLSASGELSSIVLNEPELTNQVLTTP